MLPAKGAGLLIVNHARAGNCPYLPHVSQTYMEICGLRLGKVRGNLKLVSKTFAVSRMECHPTAIVGGLMAGT